MCALASREEVSMTVIGRATGGCGFAGKKRTVGNYAVDGAANLGVADLGFGAFVFAFGGSQLALRGFSAASRLTLLHGFEMFGCGVVGGLCLHERGLRCIEIASGNCALREQLLAVVHDAGVQVEICLGLREIEFGLLHVFGNLRFGCGGIGGLGGFVCALVILRGGGEIAVFEDGEQLALFHLCSALDVEILDRRADFGAMAACASGARIASAMMCSEIGPCSGCSACTVISGAGASSFLQPASRAKGSAATAASIQDAFR